MSVATLDNLSALQKKLLRDALKAHYCKPFRQGEDSGCFGVRTFGRISGPEDFTLKRRKASKEERRQRASLRAAAGRAVARLIGRGLLECCSRGRWRLTKRGLKVARGLWPELKAPSKSEVERQIASDIVLREAIRAAKPGLGRRRKKPRAKAPQDFGELSRGAPKEVADAGNAGIEIPFDF